jgi:hypothetical protein
MDHYDLLARPDWTAKSVLIVSPYVERKFFKRIVRQLRPSKLTVVIDDGCRPEDVTMILDLARQKTQVCVALGSAPGLVHAKIFHVEWLTPGGQCRHTFVYGSGNATRQAFDGNINSEVMCKVRLTATNHAPILDWAERVFTTASTGAPDPMIPPVHDAWLANGISIRLPGMTIKHAGNKANNFDLWLQRGRLLSAFRPDPSFLRVQVKLLNELPSGDAERVVQSIGFEIPKTQRLSYPYVMTAGAADEENDAPGNWRSRYFAWTQLNDWCSDSCFRANRDQFRKAGHEDRLQNLRLLQEMTDPGPKNTACLLFLERVVGLWKAFGPQAATFLESRNGTVDHDLYRRSFEQRVDRDLELAEDEEFKNRYINGCEVIDVPRFRMDPAAWRSFVESFARQTHLEWLKKRSQSLIFQQIYKALDDVDDDTFDDPRELVKLLRSKWNTTIEGDDGEEITVGEYIDRYGDHG